MAHTEAHPGTPLHICHDNSITLWVVIILQHAYKIHHIAVRTNAAYPTLHEMTPLICCSTKTRQAGLYRPPPQLDIDVYLYTDALPKEMAKLTINLALKAKDVLTGRGSGNQLKG